MSSRAYSSRTQRPPRVASCEPCRLSKLACDHRQPCSRCVSKEIAGECMYRKNAFKRARASIPSHGSRCQSVFESTPTLATMQPVLSVNQYPDPGFQGSSSLNTVLNTLRQQTTPFLAPAQVVNLVAEDGDNERARFSATQSINSASIMEGAHLLETIVMSRLDASLNDIFSSWKNNGLESHVGAFLIQPFLNSISDKLAQLREGEHQKTELLNMSRCLFENSSQYVEIRRYMTLQDFIDQYTGSNLRWESLGAVVTLAGIAVTEFRAPHVLYATEQERQALRLNLLLLGNKCAAFCEALDVLNDIHIIFLYQTFQFQSVLYGDQSFKTWNRLNDAAGALLAAGLHEDFQDGQNSPFFLEEIRRRVFSRLYGIDISLATFLGRPPRMSRRFCCINLPLDIDESTYSLSDDSLHTELGNLDEDGWNKLGRIQMSAVMRWSTLTAMIREDTLELLLGRKVMNITQRITDLRRDIADAWGKLPHFLVTLSHDIWDGQRTRRERECLHFIRLYYLQTSFLIEWAAWRHSLESSLFVSTSELLAWVNEALVHREQLPNLGFISLAWRVASCALPAAGALALYLLQPSTQSRFKALDVTSKRKTIENFSVLIAHMDILHSPNDGNFKLFSQAKRSLQSVVDILLQRLCGDELDGHTTSPSAELTSLDWMNSDYCGFNGGFWVNFPDCLYIGGSGDTVLE